MQADNTQLMYDRLEAILKHLNELADAQLKATLEAFRGDAPEVSAWAREQAALDAYREAIAVVIKHAYAPIR